MGQNSQKQPELATGRREAWRMRVESRGFARVLLGAPNYCLFGSLARAASPTLQLRSRRYQIDSEKAALADI